MASVDETVMARLIYCCNPFKKSNHKTIKKCRLVQDWMCDFHPEIKLGMKICDSCRKQLAKERKEMLEKDLTEQNADCDDTFTDSNMCIDLLNKSLSCIEESPIIKKRIKHDSQYCKRKLEKAKDNLLTKFIKKESSLDAQDYKDSPDSIILTQLKEKFAQTESMNEKFLILTVLPKTWSCNRIQREFSISNRMARKAKTLVAEKGILSTPNQKFGKKIADDIIEKVKQFYDSDDVSRIMPGKKDYVTIRLGETRMQVQKRLILGNLKEIYQLFKKLYAEIDIGFSKFAELRPKHCVIAGGSGTHCVCVCTYHQNVKLMINDGKLKDVTVNDGTKLTDYKICLSKIMCQIPTSQCYLGNCKNCPLIESLKQLLLDHMEQEMIDSITYKQWVSVDRCNFETLTKSTEEFVENLCEQLVILKTHSFIAHQQSAFYIHIKENLHENEALMTLDFSENYSFVLQDEAQSFHWNKSQATIHPISLYYCQMGELKFKSFVIISECLIHNTVSVYTFQKKLIQFLKENFISSLEKIYYFSDGSGAQYKNRKNFFNLCCHKEDFNIFAEWHFYATAHGKGVCDGLGGTVKRLATKASLQRPYTNQIMTPLQLFHWCQENIKSIHFLFSTNEEHINEENFLKQRFEKAKTIPGTQKFHSFVPISHRQISTKVYSFSTENEKFYIEEGIRGSMDINDVKGFVTCEYDKNWWLAYVLSVELENDEVTATFLHPYGPAPSFVYPGNQDVLKIRLEQILTNVEPRTATGRTYTLTKNEMLAATNALEKYTKTKSTL